MSYRVFARKYRPQTFEEVVGQEHITRTLQNAIAGNRLAQAYLFVGPRGIGKTSTARILAKALNCVKGPTVNPCGVCDSCREITEGNSLDVLEIDGASNNSVDHVRELRESAAFSPARGPYKIYLIDEVHMLSTPAFNALLKTLEEPPAHVKFIFATTEAQKLPATITSRCQRFDLRRIPTALIASHLKEIATKEGVDLEDAAAEAIAKGADGGLRDAESMLDQLVAFCGGKIASDDVLTVFGFTAQETVSDLCDRLVQRNAAAALALIGEQAGAGKDLSRLLADLIAHLRDRLVAQTKPASASGEGIPREKLLALLDHFAEVEGRMRWATDKRLHLDIAAIKAVHIMDQTSLTDVIETLTALYGDDLPPARPIREAKQEVDSPPAKPQIRQPQGRPAEPKPEERERIATSPAPDAMKAAAPRELEETKLAAAPADSATAWRMLAAELARESVIKFGWLETGEFLECSGGVVRARFFESAREMRKSLFWPDIMKRIEAELAGRFGAGTMIECEYTMPDPVSPAEEREALQSVAEELSEPAAAAADPAEEFKNDPLIRKAIEIFKAEIQTVSS